LRVNDARGGVDYGVPNPAQKNCMGFGALVPNMTQGQLAVLFIFAGFAFFFANQLGLINLMGRRRRRKKKAVKVEDIRVAWKGIVVP